MDDIENTGLVDIEPNHKPLSQHDDEYDYDDDIEDGEKASSDLDDALNKAFDKAEGKDPEEEEPKKKPEDEEKPGKKDKPDSAEKEELKAKDAALKPAEEKARENPKPSEGKVKDPAPSQFLPEAREKWLNTPNEVKAEVRRFIEDAEREKQTYQEHVKFREELREYEEMGKQHNISIKQALDNYVDIERKMVSSPHEGFKQILTNMKMQPHEAISHILQAYGVRPEALAQHIAQSPQSYMPRQQQAQQPQQLPQLSALEQKIASLEKKLTEQETSSKISTVMPTIERFAASHPDYDELQPHIAKIIESGIIDSIHGTSLTLEQKLAEAYRMAGGRSPSRSDDNVPEHSHPEKKRPNVGNLSIGGSPNAAGIKQSKSKKSPPSIDDALENAWRRAT